MSDAGVTVKFFGDVTSINAALAKLEQKQQSLENAQKASSQRAKASQADVANAAKSMWDHATTGVTGYMTKMFAVSKIVSLVASAVGAIADRNKEWADSLGDVDKKMDDMRAKLGIQLGGADEKATGKAAVRSIEIAKAMGATGSAVQAADVSRKLASAGFSPELVKSGLLEEQTHRLNILTGNVGEGSDALGGADMLIKAINALPKGTAITEDVVRSLVTEIGNAFQLSTAEKPELFRYFQEAGLLTQMGTGRQEDLALFTMAQTNLGADRAGTGMKRFVEAFNVVKPGSTEENLLSELQIGRTDLHVSKTGSLLNSMKKLEEAMTKKGWDAVKRDEFRHQFFGEVAAPVAAYGLDREAEIRERAGLLGNEDNVERVRRGFLSSDLAVRNRRELEETALRMQENDRAGFTFADAETAAKLTFSRRRKEAGGNLGELNAISIEQAMFEKALELAKKLGTTPDDLLLKVNQEILQELKKQTGVKETETKQRKRNAQVEDNSQGQVGAFAGGAF